MRPPALFLCLIMLFCGSSFSEENAISEFDVKNHNQNALRIVTTWKTLLPANHMVEYREQTDPDNWLSTPLCTNETTEHQVTVVGLLAATDYVFRPVSDDIVGPELSISTKAMPGNLPTTALEVANQGSSPLGLTITGFPSPISTIVALNQEGKIIWYHPDSDEGDPGDFLLMADGRLAYNTYRKIKAVDYRGNEEVLLDVNASGEVCSHDFLITPEETYMYISLSSVTTNNKAWCTDDIVERDSQGTEIWRWRSADYADQLGGFVAQNRWQEFYITGYGYDWTHANSIELKTDSDGKKFVLFSIRNMNRLLKIDYPSGNILWQLGSGLDFTFTGTQSEDLQWFLCQHSAKYLSGGSVLLFDNGNDRYEGSSTNFSRALIYELDETNMTAQISWLYNFDTLASHSGNTKQLSTGDILLVFPIDSTLTYSAFVEANASEETVWKVGFTYNSPLATNFLIGILRVSSLYDLATTWFEVFSETDATSDLVLYDDRNSFWYIMSVAGTVRAFGREWGPPGSIPVRGDYDGDATNDLAVFNDTAGAWYIQSLDGDLITSGTEWGWAGAVPVPGDYDGDGTDDLALFDDTRGSWYIMTLSGSVLAYDQQWGWAGAVPVPGDYDGDGTDDLALFDDTRGSWYIMTLSGSVLAYDQQWGWAGAVPVPGDYNGDGTSDLALFDVTTGLWYILSLDQELIEWAGAWGWAGAVPVPGDYNGDGTSDLALFDDTTGFWYIVSLDQELLAWATAWGWAGAVPVGASGLNN
ncbi:aryl-sulfate sulfotransferase [Verrucomicrobiota bacterium]